MATMNTLMTMSAMNSLATMNSLVIMAFMKSIESLVLPAALVTLPAWTKKRRKT